MSARKVSVGPFDVTRVGDDVIVNYEEVACLIPSVWWHDLCVLMRGMDPQEAGAFFRDRIAQTTDFASLIAAKSVRVSGASPPPKSHPTPPAIAEWLIPLLVDRKSAEAILGDLEEIFANEFAKRGERRARWRYRMRVANSVRPLLGAVINKKAGLFAAVATVAKKYLS